MAGAECLRLAPAPREVLVYRLYEVSSTQNYARSQMRRLVIAFSFLLVAATPGDVVPQLESAGYYIEPGSSASEQVVSDAVFSGRSEGGRLYLVVLSQEPAGGATTFSDSVLDELGEGYVVTVAPETVGFAGDGSFWSADEMNSAIDASLDGDTDDQVVQLFISGLTGTGETPSPGDEQPTSEGGGTSLWVWVVLAGVGLLVYLAVRRSSRRQSERATSELEKVRAKAREKLGEIANDIIELEDEVQLSESPEIQAHYQRASSIYTATVALVDSSPSAKEMFEVVRQLDLAIWELDAAEALLDGKPIPEKPRPPDPAPPPEDARPEAAPSEREDADDRFGRRPERQSSYAGNDLMSALWAILAMSQRGGGFGGMPGGFGGPMRGGSSGGSRMRGGGFRGGGGGRMRGGGRRR